MKPQDGASGVKFGAIDSHLPLPFSAGLYYTVVSLSCHMSQQTCQPKFFKMFDLESPIFWVSLNFTAPQSVRVKMCGKNRLCGPKGRQRVIKISGISPKMSGKSAESVTMSECVTNPLVRPKMSKSTPWQLAGMQQLVAHATSQCHTI